ncbi:T9SS type A sorting domain-containing protein [Subsaxibacter sp. CAU 1640]|uniref:T9SS type A sorting domain-containing protein n=1 Tax=Subsaxibacter sp. CAU 1640 TaxID=2933271 RepID=UPI002002F6B5|nr:T9SS type A sorting domain-containing protein [Subsaxibacter sp. CAU 1640]MCK7589488.1 T9SS type A sorting domain-containing protein [Subsaxibacter sp. CAU 1640]
MKKSLLFLLLIPILTFSQQQIGQDIYGEAPQDYSGGAVSLSADGTVIAISARYNDGNSVDRGHVRIYQNQSGTWVQVGNDIDGETPGDYSGDAVSLSADGSVVAIGASSNNGTVGNDSGQVRVYQNQSGTWIQVGNDIDGEGLIDRSGLAVSLSEDGTVVAIGAPYNDNSNGGDDSGHVRVYQNQSGSWTQIGNDIDGQYPGGLSGRAISLSADGTIVAIGDSWNNGNVRVYQNQSGTWIQIGDEIAGQLGYAVSLSADGTVVAIGNPINNVNGNNSGQVRVYQNQSGIWTQLGNSIDGLFAQDNFGRGVSLSGDGTVVAISAPFNISAGGYVHIYKYQSGTWVDLWAHLVSDNYGDQFGSSVSLSADGNTLAIGSIAADGNGENSGSTKIYDLTVILSSDEFVLSQFSLFPNPARNQFTIQLNEGLQLEKTNIYNSLGQFIDSTNNTTINTSSLSSGLYYVEVLTNKGKATKKLIIE